MHLNHDAAAAGRNNRGMELLSTSPFTAETLTHREREVLNCLARGLSTPAIADELGISRATVRNHVQNILQKLEVHTKLAAVVLALRRRLI